MLATHFAEKRIPAPAARELYSAVSRQLSAFHAADFGSAYQSAAAGVQQKFSSSQFEMMIRRDFSAMMRAEHVEFGEVRMAGVAASVEVFLTAPDGAVRGFLYSFTAEADGWKIDGVQPLGARSGRPLRGLHV